MREHEKSPRVSKFRAGPVFTRFAGRQRQAGWRIVCGIAANPGSSVQQEKGIDMLTVRIGLTGVRGSVNRIDANFVWITAEVDYLVFG
jgi:hypothetical protein